MIHVANLALEANISLKGEKKNPLFRKKTRIKVLSVPCLKEEIIPETKLKEEGNKIKQHHSVTFRT